MAKLSFDDWKKSVNNEIVRQMGMEADDLPDYTYRDCYDDGVSPKTAATRAIKNAREY